MAGSKQTKSSRDYRSFTHVEYDNDPACLLARRLLFQLKHGESAQTIFLFLFYYLGNFRQPLVAVPVAPQKDRGSKILDMGVAMGGAKAFAWPFDFPGSDGALIDFSFVAKVGALVRH